MKGIRSFLFLLFATSFFFACESEKTPEEKAADKIDEGVEKIAEGFEDVAKEVEGSFADALSQLEDAVENLSEEGGKVKRKPVNFRKLKALFPDSASGFSKGKAIGESTGVAGFKVSKAETSYENGDKKVDVEIIDTGGIGMATMGLAAWSMIDIDKETENGFERTTTYKGNKAFEKCDRNRCEFLVFVAKRFLVSTKGRGGNLSIDDLHDIVNKIGLKKLERMKDEEG